MAPNGYSASATQGSLPASILAADLPDLPVEALPAVAERRIAEVWASVVGATGSLDGNANAARLDHDLYGVAGGIDGRWRAAGGTLVAGVSGGYTHADADIPARLSSADIDGGQAGVYAAFDDTRLRLSGAAAYGFHDVDTARRIVFPGVNRTARASYDAETIGVSGEAAYRFALAPGIKAGPIGTVEAAFGSHDGATETGAGALNLTIAAADYERVDLAGGALVAGEWAWGMALVNAEARLQYRHGFGDLAPTQVLAFAGAPGTPFNVTGARRGEDAIVAGFGLGASLTSALTVTADYEGDFSDAGDTHKGHLSVGYRF